MDNNKQIKINILLLFFIGFVLFRGKICFSQIFEKLSDNATFYICDSTHFAYAPEYEENNFFFSIFDTEFGKKQNIGPIPIISKDINLIGMKGINYAYLLSNENDKVVIYAYDINNNILTQLTHLNKSNYLEFTQYKKTTCYFYSTYIWGVIRKRLVKLNLTTGKEIKIWENILGSSFFIQGEPVNYYFKNGNLIKKTLEGTTIIAKYPKDIKPVRAIKGYDGYYYVTDETTVYHCSKNLEDFDIMLTVKQLNKNQRLFSQTGFRVKYVDIWSDLYYSENIRGKNNISKVKFPTKVLSVVPSPGSIISVKNFNCRLYFNHPMEQALLDSTLIYLHDDFAQDVPLEIKTGSDKKTIALVSKKTLEVGNYYLILSPLLIDAWGRRLKKKHKFVFTVQSSLTDSLLNDVSP